MSSTLDCSNSNVDILSLKDSSYDTVVCSGNPITELILPYAIFNVMASSCQISRFSFDVDDIGAREIKYLDLSDNKLNASQLTYILKTLNKVSPNKGVLDISGTNEVVTKETEDIIFYMSRHKEWCIAYNSPTK